MFPILLPLLAGLAGLFIARFLGIPGGAFVGTVVGAAVVRLSYSKTKRPPKSLQFLSRTLLGLSIGIPVTRDAIATALESLLPIGLMIIGLIGLSFLFAWLASRFSGLDFTTALCAATPGAATSMVILSDDLGGQSPIVTVLHTLRIFLIVLFIPLAVGSFQPGALAGEAASAMPAVRDGQLLYYAKLAFLVAAGLPAAYIFKRLKVPAAEILAGIVVSALSNPLFLHLDRYPSLWQFFSLWMLGTNMGAQMSRDALYAIRRHVLVSGGLTILLLATGFLMGYLLYITTSLDLVTALLGSCPGSMDAMIVFAGEMRADVPIVATMHTARQILIMLTMPFIIRKLIKKKEKTTV